MKLTPAFASSVLLSSCLYSMPCLAASQQQLSWECHITEATNVAICINRTTKIPCTMIEDTNRNHVEALRARLVRGYVYLNGSFAEIGAFGDGAQYLAHTNDGLAWAVGACYPRGEDAIWR